MNWTDESGDDFDPESPDGHEWLAGEDDPADEPVIACPECGAEVYEDSPRCPACGKYIVAAPSRPWAGKPAWLRRLAVVLLLLALAGFALLELRHWTGLGLPVPDEGGILRVGD